MADDHSSNPPAPVQGSSSSVAASSNPRPRSVDPSFAVRGSSSSVAASSNPRPTAPPRPTTQSPNSQTPSRLPPPPPRIPSRLLPPPHMVMQQQPNSQTDVESTADDSWAQFMMNDYKIRMCRRGGCRGCWLAHPGEPNRRRNHRRRYYRWEPCYLFLRNGDCPNKDLCVFSHGNYEMWYHPDHYRVYYCPYARNCSSESSDRFCPYYHTRQEIRRPTHNSAVRGYSSLVPVYSYHRPRFAAQASSPLLVNNIYIHWPRLAHQNSVLQGSSSSAAADSNQRPRLADQGTLSSAAADRNQRPRLADQGTSSSVAGAAYSNRQAAQGSSSSAVVYGTLQPSPTPPAPMMPQPNSRTPPPATPVMQQPNSETPPPATPVMQRPQSPQRHQLTDSSGAVPHLQADAASFRTKRKRDHEAGSSDN